MKRKEPTKTLMMTSNFLPSIDLWKNILALWPFQAWIYYGHLHPLQAANCGRNSRLVDEDDLNRWNIKENWHVLLKQFHGNFPSKSLSCGKINFFSGMYVKWCFNASLGLKKWNESGIRPPLCTYRLNCARRTSWGWWDDWDDTVLQTQDSKFEP